MRTWLLIPFMIFAGLAWADIRLSDLKLSGVDWKDIFWPGDASLVVVKDRNLNATPTQKPVEAVGFRLTVDGVLYYIQPMMFMLKTHPDEVCTPTGKVLAYQCKEGQRYAEGCHLMFFNEQKEWVGFHTIQIKEPTSPHFCNAMPAMGVANKADNTLLVTMQYFLIDGEGAKKVEDIGRNWYRMTSLFRVKAVKGKIELEQDDTCLGNPNRIDNIPEARKTLAACAKRKK